MQVRSDLEASRIELIFEGEDELRSFVAAAGEKGAFLIEMSERPAPFAAYSILLRLETGVEMELEASAVHIFDGPGALSVAFELKPLPGSWSTELDRRLRQAAADEDDHAEMTGVPPIVRIRQMTVRERMHLATKADRAERAALLRDTSPQVLMSLVTHPRISADDIVQIIRNPQVSPGVLDRISKESRWLTQQEIQKALVRNPKTPMTLALRLVDSLPTPELRDLAKLQAGLREHLRKAVLRVYLKRSRR